MLQAIHRASVSCARCATLLLAALPAAAQQQHWLRQTGTSTFDQAKAAAPDDSGGVYVSGWTWGSLGGSNAGVSDIWLARYDSGGNQLWIRQFGSSTTEQASAAAPDGSGGVYIGGYTYGSLGGPNAGGQDALLAHYDGSGNQLWVRQLGSSAAEEVYAAAPDGSGGVFVDGYTEGSLAGQNAGNYDAWLAHYDGAGNLLWVRQLGTSVQDDAYGAVADGSGGVYVSGDTSGSLCGPNAGGGDAWLARYDGAGNQLWSRQFGTNQYENAYGAAPDGASGMYICGYTNGSLGGPSGGGEDAWIARYDGAGNQLWVRQLGGSNHDTGVVAVHDGSGGVYLGGWTLGDLGGANQGGFDTFIAHYDLGGNQLWVGHLGSSGYDRPFGGAPDGAGGVYLSGYTTGSLGGPNAGFDDAWFARYGPTFVLLCEPGLGGVIACPCSNPPSGPARGCDNSSSTGGASLSATGPARLSSDALVFTAQDEKPTALSVLLQGTSEVSAGHVFGQGVRCVGGTLLRLYVRAANGGVVLLPDALYGDLSVSLRSAALGDTILPGQSRWYSIYYRDPFPPGGCASAATFNTGPTMQVVWDP